MILVAGIADEAPVAAVIAALEESGAAYRVFDQREMARLHVTLEIAGHQEGGTVGGAIHFERGSLALGDITALYLRLMDEQVVLDADEIPSNAPVRAHCRQVQEIMLALADVMPGRVLNRPSATLSNTSKPYQAQLIRAAGFDVPDTLITNDPDTARRFIDGCRARAAGVIYKSMSGIRSIVQEVGETDLTRLDRIRWCPTQFQRHVPGTDIRVHVIGETVLAVAIESAATDYRYAARQIGKAPDIAPIELDAGTRARCLRLARSLELPLSGIDLRRTPEGRYVCFEVNPSPAFTFYEAHAGVPIAAAVARYLAGDAA